MKYQIPQLYPVTAAKWCVGNCGSGPATAMSPSCVSGPDASGPGGCAQGAAAEGPCKVGAAAGADCTAGAGHAGESEPDGPEA